MLEQVAKAPGEFDVQARNPEHNIHIGGDSMAFGAVYGPPFVRGRGPSRRDDGRLPSVHEARPVVPGARLGRWRDLRAQRHPLDSRHLDMTYALQTLTDKIYMGNVVSGVNASDTLAMTSILFGSRRRSRTRPPPSRSSTATRATAVDDRMLEAQFGYSGAGQPVVLTPFILMGAMSPVTIPAALVQQIVEALSGIALSQLIRPGLP